MTLKETYALIGALTDKAMAEYKAIQWGTSALYITRSTETQNGAAAVFSENEDAPECFELIMPISRAWDYSRTEREIVKALRSAPICAYGVSAVSNA